MKRFGMVISHDSSSGSGVIVDGKGKRFLFSKKVRNSLSLKSKYVEFHTSLDANLKVFVKKVSLTKQEANKASFELHKSQIEFAFGSSQAA